MGGRGSSETPRPLPAATTTHSTHAMGVIVSAAPERMNDDENRLARAVELVVACGGLQPTACAFVVEGQPMAKERARTTGELHYTPSRTRDAENTIAWTARARRPRRFDGNVAVAAVFYRPNRRRVDTDNLLKTVLDGITKSGAVWADDSQVTALAGVVELDAGYPRTVIAIAEHQSSLARGTKEKTV